MNKRVILDTPYPSSEEMDPVKNISLTKHMSQYPDVPHPQICDYPASLEHLISKWKKKKTKKSTFLARNRGFCKI